MMRILEMENRSEKEFIIISMEVDMKLTTKVKKEKEKEYFIIIMEIEKWEIKRNMSL